MLRNFDARPGVLLLVIALLSAGCNSSKPQPNVEAGPNPGSGASAIVATYPAAGAAFKTSLRMEPAQPRFASKTRFRVQVTDAAGAPVSGAQVQASLVMPLMDMGKNQFPLTPAGSGEYAGQGEFSMAGEWEVVVTASAGGKNAKYTFNVKVAE